MRPITLLPLFAAAAAIAGPPIAVKTPPTAAQALALVSAQAKRENKNVLVLFHASWCGWCHRMEAFMEVPENKAILNKGLKIIWLTTLESKEKKAEENPGAEQVMGDLGGKDAGLPFFAMLDPKGKMIINSIAPKGGNTGYPGSPAEIDHFILMLSKGAPKITTEELGKLKTWLTEHAPKSSR